MSKNRFTPTQELILDVLLARHRLGEGFWTFDSRNKQSLKALEEQGVVFLMDGNVENTVRAGLTADGKKDFYSKYESPLEGKVRALEERIKRMKEEQERMDRYLR